MLHGFGVMANKGKLTIVSLAFHIGVALCVLIIQLLISVFAKKTKKGIRSHRHLTYRWDPRVLDLACPVLAVETIWGVNQKTGSFLSLTTPIPEYTIIPSNNK